ncbi:Carotenoid cleavage dioxygenase 7, chloroplastic [Dichanthelium oligosanthes]|uniref:Carotenoid cleavage dioxygenase 7, chloroplastic n=1 Tax=Dichanthelium oligosanthes TaxID=888268 RepID=A0A1E5UYH5_9POAL|nr:Carotenoid cleavage dioxygenase 7, chloroplastic [Dichanthelium oligosanthes]
MPARRLLAHYKIDPKRNRLLMVACNAEDMLLPRSNFTFYGLPALPHYPLLKSNRSQFTPPARSLIDVDDDTVLHNAEFDADFALVQKREFVVPDHLMIHDWTFTDNHYVLLGNRIKLDIPGSLLALTGTYPMIAALTVDPTRQSTPVYLLPRSPEAEAVDRDWSVPVEAPPQMWSMHVGNAFEERDDRGGTSIQLHMSGCSYQWFHFHRMFGYNWQNKKLDPSFMNIAKGREWLPRLVQVSIDLDKRGACRGCSVKRLSDQWTRPADFPAINPSFANRRNRFVYAGAASGSRRFLPYFPFDSVVKVDVSDGSARMWSAAGRKFVGEPVFVTTGGREDDGYVLLVEYAVSDHRCHLVVLDARKIGERNALVAKLEVPKHLTFPMGFHGFWADE